MKILSVCLGNICRSPLAEGIIAAKADEYGVYVESDSAGTSGWHNGEAPDSRSIQIAKERGIDISHQRSRKFTVEDFDNFDLILVMDQSNLRDVLSLARDDQDRNKVKMILNYTHPGENRKVPDPYYEGGFDYVYDLIEEAVEHMYRELYATRD